MYKGKPEYYVDVNNRCACSQLNIVLGCEGFKSVKEIDPQYLRVNEKDDKCLFFSGKPLTGSMGFNYAWDTPYNFTVVHAEPSC